jgi:hypothetical protein
MLEQASALQQRPQVLANQVILVSDELDRSRARCCNLNLCERLGEGLR